MDEDDAYDEPGGTTQKLPSGRNEDAAALPPPLPPPPKFAMELPISKAMSMHRSSFSSFILDRVKKVMREKYRDNRNFSAWM